MPSLIASIPSLDQSCIQISEDASGIMPVCSSDAASSKYVDLLVASHLGHKKVLVTSGAGFIVLSVAEALFAHGSNIVTINQM